METYIGAAASKNEADSAQCSCYNFRHDLIVPSVDIWGVKLGAIFERCCLVVLKVNES